MKTWAVILTISLFVLALLAYFVWPTPWITEPVTKYQPSEHDTDILTGKDEQVIAIRRNRFTGGLEELIGGHWHHIICAGGCFIQE